MDGCGVWFWFWFWFGESCFFVCLFFLRGGRGEKVRWADGQMDREEERGDVMEGIGRGDEMGKGEGGL